MTLLQRLAVATALIALAACEADTHQVVDPGAWTARTRGGAVVLSRDERIAVMTTRSAGVVTVFELDPGAPLEELVKTRTELDLGADSEPWAAVLSADGETAFVISRRDQTVVRIGDLRGRPRVQRSVAVGSEPTAIALAPSGNRLFVANWGEGTISVVTTPESEFEERGRIDLNQALVDTQVLGEIESRPGLAHPRALAITDDGDEEDGDETLYATEFFSMPLLDAGSSNEPGYFDRNRQGYVYPIPLARDGLPDAPIPLAPVADTGIVDANGAATGCFPNQLYAAAIDGERLFVTSVCASPVGPLGVVAATATEPANPANIKTVMHSALFVIDTETNQELPDQRQILSHELDQRYGPDGPSEVRMPLIPNDLAFTARSAANADAERGSHAPHTGCVTAMGANAVFCMRHDRKGRLLDIGEPGRRYIALDPLQGPRPARLPAGIAISQRSNFALVASEYSHSLSVLDLEAGEVVTREEPVELPRALELRESDVHAGRRFFTTGLGVWSYNGEARVSCEGCHPDGLSDGVTWFFARGPRRTLSTAPTYFGDPIERRVLLWTGNVDEVHDVEGIVRSVAGGVGAVLWTYSSAEPSNDFRIVYDGNTMTAGKRTSTLRQNLNGSVKELLEATDPVPSCTPDSVVCDRTPVREWNQVDAFIQQVRAPQRPTDLDSAQIERGAELFRSARCPSCHGGPGWTLSRVFYTPGAASNGSLPFERPTSVSAEQLGTLRALTYDVPLELRPLNPPGAGGTATFRRWDPPADRDAIAHLYEKKMGDVGYDSAATHNDDQINCVLRAVGTYPSLGSTEGVVPAGSPTAVREVRQNMMTPALGATGFNVPSLVGLASGAPYLHAGNARTLEELFDPAFAIHHQALVPGFLAEDDPEREDELRDLVAYLLSIDDDKAHEDLPARDDLCVLPNR
jgi:hypothetical protein